MRYVPTDEFAPVLRRLLKTDDAERYSIVEERAGCGTDTIDSILRERREGCDFDLADRLLCALGAQHLWWSELAHIYYAIELERACEHCGEMFELSRGGANPDRPARYCSKKCRLAVVEINRLARNAELREEARAA